jgi:hypothetical protein
MHDECNFTVRTELSKEKRVILLDALGSHGFSYENIHSDSDGGILFALTKYTECGEIRVNIDNWMPSCPATATISASSLEALTEVIMDLYPDQLFVKDIL